MNLVLFSMGFPHILHVDENGRIIGTAHRFHNARHPERMVMGPAFGRCAMNRAECISHFETCQAGRFTADYRFPFLLENLSFLQGKPGILIFDRTICKKIRTGADNAEAPVIITKAQRIHDLGLSCIHQFLYFLIRNISHRPSRRKTVFSTS